MNSPYASTTLPNGLRVLTYTDANCPVAYINLAVRAGYRYEELSERGNAHFLEHILLKGTSTYPTPDMLAEQVNRLGGYQNGTTNLERVDYVMHVANEYTEKMIVLLGDMLFNSLFDPVSVEKERGVILEEYNSNRVNHDQFLYRSITREFYQGHPLGNSSLDADEPTTSVTPELLRTYMTRWYVPERSALVIGGGIGHEQAVQMATATFAGWPSGGTQSEGVISFTPYHTPHLHIERDIEHTKLSLCYHTPGIYDEKSVAALRLISNFLGYGMSSLLTRELRHKRGLVYMANVFSDAQRDAGMFKFTSFTRKPPAEVISVARDLIEHVTDNFRPEDLDWVRRQYLGVYARNLAETSSRTDFLLDSFVIRDALYTPDEWVAVVNALTYDDIVKTAVSYLNRNNSMLATMGKVDPGDL